MSTPNFTHSNKDGIEQYAFPSAVNKNQTHFIDREEGGPWEISLVDVGLSRSLEDIRTLITELEKLCDFTEKLNGSELHRRTEPGEPELNGIGGGL